MNVFCLAGKKEDGIERPKVHVDPFFECHYDFQVDTFEDLQKAVQAAAVLIWNHLHPEELEARIEARKEFLEEEWNRRVALGGAGDFMDFCLEMTGIDIPKEYEAVVLAKINRKYGIT